MDDEHHKYLQMQDEMSRFEAEISGGEPLPLQPPRCIIGAGTYGAMQSRLEGGFEGARLAFEAPPLLVPSAVARRAAPPLALFGAFAPPEPPPPPPRAQPVVLSSAPQLYDKSQQEENERRKEMESNNFPQPLVVPKPAKEFEQPEPVPYYNSHQKDTDSQSSGKSNKKEKKNRKLIRTAGGQVWEDTTLNDWPDDDYRLFCGDLGNDVTDELLIRTFGKYSSFQRAKVVRDKRTNKSKGFGFVSFKDPSDFIKAMKEMNGRYVGSRPIKLRKSTWRNRSLDVVRKKEKEKAALIAMFTGGKKNN